MKHRVDICVLASPPANPKSKHRLWLVILNIGKVREKAHRTTQEARLDQFRVVMNWNRDELAQWALAHAQREDDALALEAYRRRVR